MTIDVKALVANRLVQLAPSVSEAVVDQLAGKEHSRRISAFLVVVDELDKATKELRKVKPDNVQYNKDGSEASATYSKATLDAMKKLEEQIAKYNKAIDATEAEPRDFSKVIEIAKL
jgi:hypothetical protein